MIKKNKRMTNLKVKKMTLPRGRKGLSYKSKGTEIHNY